MCARKGGDCCGDAMACNSKDGKERCSGPNSVAAWAPGGSGGPDLATDSLRAAQFFPACFRPKLLLLLYRF